MAAAEEEEVLPVNPPEVRTKVEEEPVDFLERVEERRVNCESEG